MSVSQLMRYTVDINQPMLVNSLRTPFVQGDEQAHTIVLTVLQDGTAADLSSVTCAGSVVRADGTVVGMTGTVSGNTATVVIPNAAYNVVGRINIIVKLNSSTEERTALMINAVVTDGDAGTVVESTTTLDTVSAVLAQAQAVLDSIPDDYTAMSEKLASMEIATDSEAAEYLGGD